MVQAALLPALLSNIFVCISFHWNVTKLGYLQQVLTNIDSYPTHVEVALVTEHVSKLHEVVGRWQLRHHVRVVGPASSTYAEDDNRYRLVWEHRHYAEAAFNRGAFSTYMYLEDDTFIPWPSLLSWAFDTEALAPLGFMRGFYRTEVDDKTGHLLLLDVRRRLDLAAWNRTVQLPAGLFVCPAREHRWGHTAGAPPHLSHQSHQGHRNRTCLVHSSYLQLPFPFMGMWIATHEQLRAFIGSPGWRKEAALQQPIVSAAEDIRYGYPERSTIFSQLASVPEGFFTASIVPIDSEANQLAEVAAISHLRNGYIGSSKNYSSIPVTELFL